MACGGYGGRSTLTNPSNRSGSLPVFMSSSYNGSRLLSQGKDMGSTPLLGTNRLVNSGLKIVPTVNTDLALKLPPARNPPRKQLKTLELTSGRVSSDMWHSGKRYIKKRSKVHYVATSKRPK